MRPVNRKFKLQDGQLRPIDLQEGDKDPSLKLSLKKITLFFIDGFFGFISLYCAILLRFDWEIPSEYLLLYFDLLPFVFLARAASYLYFKFYSRVWEYVSLEDLMLILKAVIVGSLLVLFSTFLYNRALSIPRSVLVIDMVLLSALLGGSRILWRVFCERRKQQSRVDKTHWIRVLVFGAGDTGALLLRNLRKQNHHYNVVGFIDDDPSKRNKVLMDVKILGNRDAIPELVQKHDVTEILIAAKNISPECLAEIVDLCNSMGIKFKIVGSIMDMGTNEIHVTQIRNIEISDLLGREPVSLDISSIQKMVQGKRVLVTGAGGSIGSELCRQILEFAPATLVMIDSGENYLYELEIQLQEFIRRTEAHYLYCSVTNQSKMDQIFSKFKPQLVFHAAAHKHVPLMERNSDEAVFNNVGGTKVTTDLSDKHGVEKFVLVSTDKVVRPTSVMGVTKKIAEQYIQFMSRKSATQFMTVRFGNVLGSKGSVVPLFQKQIERGGPVTVTHPEMKRYFMLIPEAAQLILQAAALGRGGEIFLLEMGELVRVVDMAEKMIQLAGYTVNQDMEIKFVGMRPGEKMVEELMLDSDELVQTIHKKIKVLKSNGFYDEGFKTRMEDLLRKAKFSDLDEVKKGMLELINEPKITDDFVSSQP